MKQIEFEKSVLKILEEKPQTTWELAWALNLKMKVVESRMELMRRNGKVKKSMVQSKNYFSII